LKKNSWFNENTVIFGVIFQRVCDVFRLFVKNQKTGKRYELKHAYNFWP